MNASFVGFVEMTGWRAIKSAPKDGSKFLFCEKGGRIQVGRFASQWGEKPEIYVCLTNTAYDFYPSLNPTHWMPLPELPSGDN